MIKDYFTISYKEIRRKKLRSWLTLIGIIIGISAVISLILLGSGLKNAIESQAQGLGSDKLLITAKGNPLTPGLSTDAVNITTKDQDVVDRVSGVKKTSTFSFTTAQIDFNDNVRYFPIFGSPTDPEERKLIGESQNYDIGQGRSFNKGEKFKAVLGFSHLDKNLFGKAAQLGDSILVNGHKFKVIGFMEKIGSPPDDQSVTIPLEIYSDIFETGDERGMIIAQVGAGEDATKIGQDVKKALRKHRNQKEGKEDFNVQTPEDLLGTFNIILDMVQAVLIGIAGISLVVGGVGIMNTMYTSVLERTKQVGIIKSLGAKNSQVLALFIVESGFYGLGGGIVGIIVGVAIAKFVELVFKLAVGPAFLLIKIDPLLLIGALTFSFVIGTLSGIAPAYQASKMKPVDSLRYE